MALQTLLAEPSYSFRQVVPAESALRERYLSLDSGRFEVQYVGISATELLTRSAALLEFLLVAACTFEVLDDIDDAKKGDQKQVLKRVRSLTHLDIGAVLHSAAELLDLRPPQHPVAPISLAAVIRVMRSTLSACPISALEKIASDYDAEEVGHRCRVAFDSLQAFLLRVDPSRRERVQVLGTVYAAGGMSPSDVALVLEASVPDTVATLESYGYARPLEALSLSDTARRAVYAKLREDRVGRANQLPELSDHLVSRDVIASERIEGVDVRNWM